MVDPLVSEADLPYMTDREPANAEERDKWVDHRRNVRGRTDEALRRAAWLAARFRPEEVTKTFCNNADGPWTPLELLLNQVVEKVGDHAVKEPEPVRRPLPPEAVTENIERLRGDRTVRASAHRLVIERLIDALNDGIRDCPGLGPRFSVVLLRQPQTTSFSVTEPTAAKGLALDILVGDRPASEMPPGGASKPDPAGAILLPGGLRESPAQKWNAGKSRKASPTRGKPPREKWRSKEVAAEDRAEKGGLSRPKSRKKSHG